MPREIKYERVSFEFSLMVKEPINEEDKDVWSHQVEKDLSYDKHNFERIINEVFREFMVQNPFIKEAHITVKPIRDEDYSFKVVRASSEVEFIIK